MTTTSQHSWGVSDVALSDTELRDLPFDPRKRPDPKLVLPDLKDAVIGWRVWRVKLEAPRYGLPPKLCSATFPDYYWTPRRAAIADCEYKDCQGDNLPGESCSCGFYSAKSLKHLLGMGYHIYDAESGTVCVIGKVACWGKVIEGSQGWRSAKAYPVALFVPFEASHLAQPLAKAYGAKVSLMNFLDRQAR